MKTSSLPLLLMILTACGPDLEPEVSPEPPAEPAPAPAPKPQREPLPMVCAIDCLAGVRAAAGTPVNCAKTAVNVALLVRKLVETKIAADKAEACAALAGVTIEVGADGAARGEYGQDKRIAIGQDQVSLGHETLHAWEHFKGTIDWQAPHAGWAENAKYSAFVDQYVRMMQR